MASSWGLYWFNFKIRLPNIPFVSNRNMCRIEIIEIKWSPIGSPKDDVKVFEKYR